MNTMKKNPINLLLVEDELPFCNHIQTLLAASTTQHETAKVIIWHATSFTAALTYLNTRQFDIILLDLSLPDADGLTAFGQLKTVAPTIPVITLSSTTPPQKSIQVIQLGAQDHLHKQSLTPDGLLRAILFAIEREYLITDYTRTTLELSQKAAELENRNLALDEFGHTMAHQIQGLLGQMVGYASLLEMQFGGSNDPTVVQSMSRIVESGHKMNNVITELLLLASLRSGEIEVYPLNMRHIVNEAKKRLRYQILETEATIIVAEEWPAAIGHASWIEEAWLNYISNALKYGGDTPTIELGANVHDDGMIRFWVQDDGAGLTELEQQRLFRPHTRLRPKHIRGEGLGLSIVNRIVKKCGGDVGVESELDVGSTFWFTLPAINST